MAIDELRPGMTVRVAPGERFPVDGEIVRGRSDVDASLVAGFIAKLIIPGDDPGGFILTAVIGIVGGVIGGFVGNLLGFGGVDGLNIGSIVLAVVGAAILLVGYRMVKKKA
jgi:uncharacterized membrane protein YeaQ/YmgE (transglycosylase-associated protein family)